MPRLFCACCARPFQRVSLRGPAPLYCSDDCRRQMAVRRRVWMRVETGVPYGEAAGANRNESDRSRHRAA